MRAKRHNALRLSHSQRRNTTRSTSALWLLRPTPRLRRHQTPTPDTTSPNTPAPEGRIFYLRIRLCEQSILFDFGARATPELPNCRS
jgi:hypothetical protein